MSFEKIVIPLDGSELAEEAVAATLPLVRAFSSELVLVGVVDLTAGMYDVYSEAFNPVDLRAHLEGFLEASLERARAQAAGQGATARTVLRVGVPHEEIAALAGEEDAHLIVMTTHGRKGLSHLLLGSVAEKVIRTAPCPVLVVRPTGPPETAA